MFKTEKSDFLCYYGYAEQRGVGFSINSECEGRLICIAMIKFNTEKEIRRILIAEKLRKKGGM